MRTSIITAVVLLSLASTAHAITPEPFAINVQLNGKYLGAIDVPFDFEKGEVYLNQDALNQLKIDLTLNEIKKVTEIKELISDFNLNTMTLSLKTDGGLINSNQDFSLSGKSNYAYSPSLDSAYLNYAINSNQDRNVLSFEAGVNFKDYQFHSSMQCKESCVPSVFSFINNDLKNLKRTEIGDFVNARGDEILGASYGTFYRLNPYFIKQPTASFSGVAQNSSKVEVQIDGVTTFTKKVDAGKFSINDIRNFSGRHNLSVLVTDAFGQLTTFNKDLFSTQNLLAKELEEYQISAGLKRLDRSVLDYDGFLLSGFYRKGITDTLTAGANFSIDENNQQIGIDADYSLKNGNTFSFLGNASAKGDYLAATNLSGISENNIFFWSLNGRVSKSVIEDSIEKSSIDTFVSASISSRVAKSVISATLSNETRRDENLSKLTLSSTIPLYKSTLIASSTVDSNGEYQVNLGVNFKYGNASVGFKDNVATTNLSFNKNPQVATDLGLRASFQTKENTQTVDTSVSKGFDNFFVNANCRSSSSATNCDSLLAGSIFYSKPTGVMLSRPIRDGFLIANAGAENAEIGINGRAIGKTGKSGLMLLPEVSSFNVGQVNLSASSVGEGYVSDRLSDTFLVQQYAGATVNFGLKKVRAAYGKIKDFGVVAYTLDAKEKGFISSTGEFYIDDIQQGKHRLVLEKQNPKTGNFIKHECNFETKDSNETLENVGSISCSLIQ